MPTYEVTDPQTGRKLRLTGDSPPTEQELTQIFSQQTPPEPRTRTEQFLRQQALGARGVIQGAADLAGIVTDPITSIMGVPSLSQSTSGFLTRAGVPEAQTPGERIAQDVIRGGTGGVLTMGAGTVSALVAKAPALARVLTSPLEFIAGTAGGGGAGTAREAGFGPVGQTIAGLGAGIAAPSAVIPIMAATRGAARISGTLTRGGTQTRVGQTLLEQADEPSGALSRLASAEEIVPGSPPTTGVVSGDVGLLGMEARMRAVEPQAFGMRFSQQNVARRRLLDDIIKGDPEAMRAARDAETTLARNAALRESPPTDIQPVLTRIDQIVASPAGKRDAVSRSMAWLRKKLEGITDPSELYEIRKDLGDALGGRLSGDQSGFRTASRELIQVRRVLDDAIEATAPGFKAYLNQYKNLSRLADQAENLRRIRDRANVAVPDPITGEMVFSQAKFRNHVNSERVRGVLTDEQFNVLDTISSDLDRGVAINSGVVKAAGSDTIRNSTVGTLIGRALPGLAIRNPGIRLLMKPLEWLSSVPAEAQRDLLLETMLDPELAAGLLRRATKVNIQRMSISLQEKAAAIGIGAGISQRQTPEPQVQPIQ